MRPGLAALVRSDRLRRPGARARRGTTAAARPLARRRPRDGAAAARAGAPAPRRRVAGPARRRGLAYGAAGYLVKYQYSGRVVASGFSPTFAILVVVAATA